MGDDVTPNNVAAASIQRVLKAEDGNLTLDQTGIEAVTANIADAPGTELVFGKLLFVQVTKLARISRHDRPHYDLFDMRATSLAEMEAESY